MATDSVKYIHDEYVHNELSSSIILPLVFDIFSPSSILDVGCGLGTWLSVSKKLGVTDVLGLDGNYLDKELLYKYLSPSEFRDVDLIYPVNLERRFDLIICLEVAEHLPEFASKNLVNSLVEHSDVILFSAAIPGQGGQNHINEQWPDYWIEIFDKKGFVFIDSIRPIIWNDKRIDFWYRQNIFFVVKKGHILSNKNKYTNKFGVHPELFEFKIKEYNYLKSQLFESKRKLLALNSGNVSFAFIFKIFLKKVLNTLKIKFYWCGKKS